MLKILRIRAAMYALTALLVGLSIEFLPPPMMTGVLTGGISIFTLSPVVLLFTVLTNYQHSRTIKNGALLIWLVLGIASLVTAAVFGYQGLAFIGTVTILCFQESLLYSHEKTLKHKLDQACNRC